MTLFIAPDGQPRCAWAGSAPQFLSYHDCEWGFPVDNDIKLFEKICLEGFQSGLSWRTILAKRENFRKAFSGFDFFAIAKYKSKDIDRLLQNEGIVRHKGKIDAVINNAQKAVEMHAEFGSLAAFFWSYEPKTEPDHPPQSQSSSPQSIALSKELKKRGWKFVGPTTVYAFMQAMGLINDHASGCITRPLVTISKNEFKTPKTSQAKAPKAPKFS